MKTWAALVWMVLIGNIVCCAIAATTGRDGLLMISAFGAGGSVRALQYIAEENRKYKP